MIAEVEPKWRERYVTPSLRYSGLLGSGVPLVGYTFMIIAMPELGVIGRFILGVVTSGVALIYGKIAYYNSLVITNRGVCIRNTFKRYDIAWQDVIRFVATTTNLALDTTTHGRITVKSLQAANVTRLLDRESRIDRLARQLNQRMENLQQYSRDADVPLVDRPDRPLLPIVISALALVLVIALLR